MAGEIDACRVIPHHPKAYDRGIEMGKQAASEGKTGDAWQALAQYTQGLFEKIPTDMPFDKKQKLWREQQTDVLAGMACGDPRDFKYVTVGGRPGDPRIWHQADMQNQATALLDTFDRFNANPHKKHSAEPATDLDTVIGQANAQLHNRIEPLGSEAVKAFAAEFNQRRASMLNIKDTSLKAEVLDDGRRILIRKEVN